MTVSSTINRFHYGRKGDKLLAGSIEQHGLSSKSHSFPVVHFVMLTIVADS